MDQLEALVLRLENDDALGLDDAVAAYEEGVELARRCLATLRTAEARIQHLSLEDDDDDV